MTITRFLMLALLTAAPCQAVALDFDAFRRMEPIGDASPTPVCGEGNVRLLAAGCFFIDSYSEPVLPVTSEDTLLSLRIVYQPSFFVTSVVRVELKRVSYGVGASFTVHTIATSQDTQGLSLRVADHIYEPASSEMIARDFLARQDEAWLVLRALDPSGFWDIPSQRAVTVSCLDSTDWTIEMMDREHYHLVDLPCGVEHDLRHDALYELIHLVALIARSHLANEIDGFPY